MWVAQVRETRINFPFPYMLTLGTLLSNTFLPRESGIFLKP